MLHIILMNKVFSDFARRASIEARRAKSKSKPEKSAKETAADFIEQKAQAIFEDEDHPSEDN